MRIWLISASLFIFTAITPVKGFAQDNSSSIVEQSLQDAMIIGGTAVGGAVLGLSTLSFVEEPGDHLKNILVGGAVGIIVGVGLVAYMQANKSQTIYKQTSVDSLDFETSQRVAWHQKEHSQTAPVPPAQVGYQFSF
ncbi:MAG: hypothetical protein COW01_05495 [Bdellovibrionales bacterium CG12_big_fil_rev_8_21_14_0_65_38_15]|nr:MAG: hypothetical protein COW79_03010 [Bdellovibrionales bacterium CG22_combo_CG10-13_8_21_14_all_38_13]PIQ56081.1 MAG: hypothetical protein COW01_05495 [Bdellovibrionales bacterium CG12_big_fil_rev_8_21_14_0_65_38_15]PIR28630.1 MAG: hypothetical protein COV38_14800 [Bdellovibrionales bacterium CG11_big_fil_rev_8_21_14_0_20_38_13]